MLPQESYIKNLDLEYLANRLVDKEGWSLDEARETIRRYKNFLILLLRYPHKTLAPASDIDEAWHNHILYTHEYMRDCEVIFGYYLHHTPAQRSDLQAKLLMEEAQERSEELYMREFNEPYSLNLNVAGFW